jgi:N-acylglucosamine-6-phosphate 2-epimerase
MDATRRARPDGETLASLYAKCRKAWPQTILMADCSDEAEGLRAKALGFDLIGTTLAGYTEYTQGLALPDFALMERLVGADCRVIAEGGIWTPEQLAQAMRCGVHAAVVGTAITRPMEITRRFAGALRGKP